MLKSNYINGSFRIVTTITKTFSENKGKQNVTRLSDNKSYIFLKFCLKRVLGHPQPFW